MNVSLRGLLARSLGSELTPELAAQIEVAAMRGGQEVFCVPEFAPQRCASLMFAAEPFADVLSELHLMHQEHWSETERHRHGLKLNPDYECMLADAAAGRLIQFTARHEGKLVGNLRVYLGRSRHTQTVFGSEDTLYLTPLHRRGRNAMRFVQYAEKCLASMGVAEVRCNAKTVNRTSDFLQAMGYMHVANELVKMLPIPNN